jgi:hypothetical protein
MERFGKLPARTRLRREGGTQPSHATEALNLLGTILCGSLLAGCTYLGVGMGGTAARDGHSGARMCRRLLGIAGITSRRIGWLIPVLICCGAALLAWRSWDTLLLRPLGNPFGYSNAIGSFYMLAAAAALIAGVRVPARYAGYGFGVLAAAFASVPWMNGTTTAAVLVLLLPLGLFPRTGPMFGPDRSRGSPWSCSSSEPRSRWG